MSLSDGLFDLMAMHLAWSRSAGKYFKTISSQGAEFVPGVHFHKGACLSTSLLIKFINNAGFANLGPLNFLYIVNTCIEIEMFV